MTIIISTLYLTVSDSILYLWRFMKINQKKSQTDRMRKFLLVNCWSAGKNSSPPQTLFCLTHSIIMSHRLSLETQRRRKTRREKAFSRNQCECWENQKFLKIRFSKVRAKGTSKSWLIMNQSRLSSNLTRDLSSKYTGIWDLNPGGAPPVSVEGSCPWGRRWTTWTTTRGWSAGWARRAPGVCPRSYPAVSPLSSPASLLAPSQSCQTTGPSSDLATSRNVCVSLLSWGLLLLHFISPRSWGLTAGVIFLIDGRTVRRVRHSYNFPE